MISENPSESSKQISSTNPAMQGNTLSRTAHEQCMYAAETPYHLSSGISSKREKGIISLKLYRIVVMPAAGARAAALHVSTASRCHVVHQKNQGPIIPATVGLLFSLSRGMRGALVRQLVPYGRVVRRHAVHLVHLEFR